MFLLLPLPGSLLWPHSSSEASSSVSFFPLVFETGLLWVALATHFVDQAQASSPAEKWSLESWTDYANYILISLSIFQCSGANPGFDMLGKHFTTEPTPVLPVLTILYLITSFTPTINGNVKSSPLLCWKASFACCGHSTADSGLGLNAVCWLALSLKPLGILEALRTYHLILIISCLFQSQSKTRTTPFKSYGNSWSPLEMG